MLTRLLLVVALLVGVACYFGLVNIRQTRQAQLPHVSVTQGQAPRFDADVATLNVSMKNEMVAVPSIKLTKPHH